MNEISPNIPQANSLLAKVEARVIPMLNGEGFKKELSGSSTPKILFHGFARNKQLAREKLQHGNLNEGHELLWFTNTAHRAANYGLRIRAEYREELEKLGITREREKEILDNPFTQDPAQYDIARLQDDTRYIVVIFPHENTQLDHWVKDYQPTMYHKSFEYITDEGFPLGHVLFVRMDKLQPFIDEIEQGNIQTRKVFMEKLGITDEDQTHLREKLNDELAK